MALKIGIAGPVGSGKTSLIESLTNILKDKYSLGIVTNDIYTTEDANYLKQHLDLDENRIIGVETGGCPHTAIRDDISMNQRAVIELEEKFNPDIVFVESGGDNLSATFSYELIDYYMYIIDVAQGADIPRKKGLPSWRLVRQHLVGIRLDHFKILLKQIVGMARHILL